MLQNKRIMSDAPGSKALEEDDREDDEDDDEEDFNSAGDLNT